MIAEIAHSHRDSIDVRFDRPNGVVQIQKKDASFYLHVELTKDWPFLPPIVKVVPPIASAVFDLDGYLCYTWDPKSWTSVLPLHKFVLTLLLRDITVHPVGHVGLRLNFWGRFTKLTPVINPAPARDKFILDHIGLRVETIVLAQLCKY